MKPVTIVELKDALDDWAPKYDLVTERFPDASVEDKLKILENLGAKAIAKRVSDKIGPFGFNKKTKTE